MFCVFGVPFSVWLSSCLRLSHFELSWRRRGWRQGLKDVALAVVGKSAIYSQPDNAAFDMTVQSAHRLNQVGLVVKRSRYGQWLCFAGYLDGHWSHV